MKADRQQPDLDEPSSSYKEAAIEDEGLLFKHGPHELIHATFVSKVTRLPRIKSFSLPGLVFAEIKTKPNLVMEAGIHKDYIHFKIPLSNTEAYKINGQQSSEPRMHVTVGGDTFISGGPGRHALALTVPITPLVNTIAALRGVDPTDVHLASGEHILPRLAMDRLRQRLSVLLDSVANGEMDPSHPLDSIALEREITNLLFDYYMCSTRTPDKFVQAARSATKIVRKAEDRFMEKLSAGVSLADLCESTGVSADALGAAFNLVCDETPMRYFKRRRLSIAHGQLLKNEPERSVVKRIALDSGLTELGRFANEYQALFGELPSATLQRSPQLQT